jgi:hypothetical protein
MKRKRLPIITILFITAIILFLYFSNNYQININSNNSPIDTLINNSLSIQYGNSDIDLDKVYTNEFIDSIDNNFYKEKLAPYKIAFRNYKLRDVRENEFVVSVHIKDKDGKYIQVIHIKQYIDKYLISKIEYDI